MNELVESLSLVIPLLCGPAHTASEVVHEYGEEVKAVGIIAYPRMLSEWAVSLTVNEATGTWTLLVSDRGTSCVLGLGTRGIVVPSVPVR